MGQPVNFVNLAVFEVHRQKGSGKVIGLMVVDCSKERCAEEKITAAVAKYRSRYGREPERCEVHPSTAAPDAVAGVRVVAKPYVMPNNFFVGFEEKRSGDDDADRY